MIELVEVDVGEVLRTHVPQWNPSLALRRAVDHFAKKPVKTEEVLVFLGVLLLELLEPLRDDLLEHAAVDAVEKLADVDLDDRRLVAPLHAGDPHVMLYVEGGSDGAFSVHTRK